MATSAKKNKKSAEKKAREQMRYEYHLMQRQQEREQAWSAEQARRSQEFTAQQTAQQMAFQREMSDTAHQREVADLQAAGLNPVLSVSGGSGASTPQGSAGQGEQPNYVSSIVSAMPALFATMHEQAAAMKAAARSASHSARVVNQKKNEGYWVQTPTGNMVHVEGNPEEAPKMFDNHDYYQGSHAGQGAYHGTAKGVQAMYNRLDEAKKNLWNTMSGVNISGSTPFRQGSLPRITASTRIENPNEFKKALNEVIKAQGALQSYGIVQSGREQKKWWDELKEAVRRSRERIDNDSYRKFMNLY